MSSQPPSRNSKTIAPMNFIRSLAFLLRSIACNLGFYTGFVLLTGMTILLSPPVYLLLRLSGTHDTGQAVRRIIWFYGKAWLGLISIVVPFRITARNMAHCPPNGIVVANHLSFFDAFCLAALPMYNLVFAVRSWPFKIPFYGPYMHRANYLNTEKMEYGDFLKEARARLEQGMTMIIFPEGTRSTTGNLGRFHSGAFKLAMETGTPVIPVCLNGTGTFLPKGKFWLKPTPVNVEILAPVDPKQFAHHGPLAHLKMSREVKRLMAQKIIPAQAPGTAPGHTPEPQTFRQTTPAGSSAWAPPSVVPCAASTEPDHR